MSPPRACYCYARGPPPINRHPRSLRGYPCATLERGVADVDRVMLGIGPVYIYIYIYVQPIPEHGISTGVARHHTTNCRETAEGILCQDHTPRGLDGHIQRKNHPDPSADPFVKMHKSWAPVRLLSSANNTIHLDPSQSIRRSISKSAQVVGARAISQQREQHDQSRSITIHPPIHP